MVEFVTGQGIAAGDQKPAVFLTYFALLVAVSLTILLQDNSSHRVAPIVVFLWVLGFTLAFVIPFIAFRSLSSEFEGDTLQLVSITTMKPYQIVLGKPGSAVLQMLIYLSVLAPCIMFTYLLRGTALEHVLLGLGGRCSVHCA